MLNQATMNRLHEMHFTAMADTYREQAENPSQKELSFDEWFGLMVDAVSSQVKDTKIRHKVYQQQAVSL